MVGSQCAAACEPGYHDIEGLCWYRLQRYGREPVCTTVRGDFLGSV